MLVSYNLDGEVNLSLFGIASKQIGLPTSHPSPPSSHNLKPSFFGGQRDLSYVFLPSLSISNNAVSLNRTHSRQLVETACIGRRPTARVLLNPDSFVRTFTSGRHQRGRLHQRHTHYNIQAAADIVSPLGSPVGVLFAAYCAPRLFAVI